jgi:hypothetical protein
MRIKTDANSVLPQFAVTSKLKLITPIKLLYRLTVVLRNRQMRQHANRYLSRNKSKRFTEPRIIKLINDL